MDDLRRTYRTTVIIGLVMMASLVIYLIVVSLLDQARSAAEVPPPAVQGAAYYACIGISIVVILLARSASAMVLNARGASEPQPLQRLQTAAIITFALSEVPAVLGLVLFILGGSATDFYLFLLISLFSFSLTFPKFSQWEEWGRKRR